MNEQIQKLYDQADKFAKENRTQTISGPGNNYFELFHEKFAQLIVRECADIATINQHEWHSAGSYVLKHFGFEK
jgi:hypothetical protein